MTDGRTRNVTVLIFGALTDALARYWRRLTRQTHVARSGAVLSRFAADTWIRKYAGGDAE